MSGPRLVETLPPSRIHRGEIWLYTPPNKNSPANRDRQPSDKRRPVVILSRQRVIGLLRTVMVAPVTSAIRGLPSEVPLDESNGLKHASAANLDHIQTVNQQHLRQFVGSLTPEQMRQICRALSIATGCD